MPEDLKRLPTLSFATRREWEQWLGEHHATSAGLWLKIMKKGSAIDTVSYADALESALCYGWIDGQRRSFDEQSWLVKFTRRGRKSRWSRVNRDKATALLKAGQNEAGRSRAGRAGSAGR